MSVIVEFYVSTNENPKLPLVGDPVSCPVDGGDWFELGVFESARLVDDHVHYVLRLAPNLLATLPEYDVFEPVPDA